MTNAQIILNSMVLNNIDFDTKVDTFAGWKRNGYAVKKGEKAAFKTTIWKPTLGGPQDEECDDVSAVGRKMYLVNACFFTQDQVEEIKDEE